VNEHLDFVCTICGEPSQIPIPGPKQVTEEGGTERGDICLDCFLMWARTNEVAFDLLSLVNQIDILAGSVLGETGPVPSEEVLREWAIQLRTLAAPVLSHIYRDAEAEDLPETLIIPEPPSGVSPLDFYLEMMRERF
jgi:hypothetical protein